MEYLVKKNENDIEKDINSPRAVRLVTVYVIVLAIWFISLIVILLLITPTVDQIEKIGSPLIVYTIITVVVFIITIFRELKGLWLAIVVLLSIVAFYCIYLGGFSIGFVIMGPLLT